MALQVTVISGVTAGLQGLMAILLAKWLGATDRGVLALAQTLVSLIVLTLSFGLISSARIVLSSPEWAVSLRSFVATTRVLLLVDLVVSCVAAVTVFPWLSRVTDPYLAAGFVVMSLAHLRSGLLREGLQGVGRHRTAMSGELMGAICSLLVLTLLWATHTLDLRTGMLAVVVRPIFHYLFQLVGTRGFVLAEPADATPSTGLLRRMVVFSLPGLVVAGGATISSQMDRLLLGAFAGPAPVGVYASAATLATLAGTLPSAVSPMIVRQIAVTKDLSLHARWWRRGMLGSVLLSMAILVVGAVLLEVFLGGEFAGSTGILALLLVGGLAMASQQIDNAANNGLGDIRAGASCALIGIPVGLLAYLFLIPFFGVLGCALGNVCTFVAMAITARILLRREIAKVKASA